MNIEIKLYDTLQCEPRAFVCANRRIKVLVFKDQYWYMAYIPKGTNADFILQNLGDDSCKLYDRVHKNKILLSEYFLKVKMNVDIQECSTDELIRNVSFAINSLYPCDVL